MAHLNSLAMVGRIVSEPIFKDVAGKRVCELRIANDTGRKVKGSDEWLSNFWSVETWGQPAERLEKMDPPLGKGDLISVSGKLDKQYWEKDGQKQEKPMINAFDVNRIKAKADTPDKAPKGRGNTKPATPAVDLDDEIPF